MATSLRGSSSDRPLGPPYAATLDWLTTGLGFPGRYGILMSREIGDAGEGAPTVDAEYLGDCHFRVTRYIELEWVRSEDHELNDRVADPQVDFFRRDGGWFPLAASSILHDISEQGVHAVAEAMLRDVACEHELSKSAGRSAPLVRLAASLWALVRELPRRRRRALL